MKRKIKAGTEKRSCLVEFEYDERIVNAIKEWFPFYRRAWIQHLKCWKIQIYTPQDLHAFELLIEESGFVLTEDAKEKLNQLEVAHVFYDSTTDCFAVDEDMFSKIRNNFLKKLKVGVRKGFVFVKRNPLVAEELKKLNAVFSKDAERAYEEMKESYEKSHSIRGTMKMSLKLDLYDFQSAGVEFALEKGCRVMIADEMGLGKTVQAICTVYKLKAFPCLVVCPATLKLNWEREIKKFTDCTVFVVNGSPKTSPINLASVARSHDFVIMNYDILKDWKDHIKAVGFQAVVFDESHYLKNFKAKRTKAALEISKYIPRKILLTGTPILNRPAELAPQLEVLGYFKNVAGSWKDYVTRYCGARETKFGLDVSGATNTRELNKVLRSLCVIRRSKEDVLDQLPDKIRNIRFIELDEDKMAEYKELETELNREVATLYREMRKEDGDPSSVQRFRFAVLKRAVKLWHASGLLKIPDVVKDAELFFENEPDSKLVVFAYHRDVQEILYKAMAQRFETLWLSADLKTDQRMEVIKNFNESDVRVLVVSLKVGGEGINLTGASHAYFAELYWTPAVIQQCEDRLHRIGQEKNVLVTYSVASGTIDEKIVLTLEKKSKIAGDVLGDEKKAMFEIALEDFKKFMEEEQDEG